MASRDVSQDGFKQWPRDGAPSDEFFEAVQSKVASGGGFPAYEKAHRTRLAKAFARVVFPRLPIEVVSHVVVFAFHIGYY